MDDSRSRDLYDRALSVLPGGVNSSVRATIPYPAFAERGEGGHLIDADGNRYIDYVMAYGPLLLGHDMPESVRAAVQSYASDGPLYGAPTEVEVELAEFVTRHVPSVEMVRFVNSGTEATVSAVRLARGYTGRDKIIMMEGGYHGAQESTAVSFTTTGIPDSFAEHTITVPFNDEGAIHEALEEHGDDVACVLVEPVLGNNGIVEPVEGYHAALRDLCDEYGALLAFDEVITGFRVGGLGCAQGRFGVEPDLTTLGKVIGGGFPVGALGGRAEIMEHLSPFGDVFQAGTFSGHPVTMAAGLETLRYAAENDVHEHVADLGERLRSGLEDIVADQAPNYTVVGTDSMFKVIFTRDGGPVRNAGDVADAETTRWERIFRPKMKERGVFLPANQFESQFVCGAHDEDDVDETLDAYAEAL